ncbi:FAD-dependent monooxygenase [Amycolatopsis jejuensis]|uniref:FAD-dependent monooxygenase n=1 Tax=Amycolatopsis jejuensis TaxID=330084 RepID=UPI00052544E6|nr:FAD-dependent monooxygenase [Amycolatopsis jejuensis]
MDVLIVGAGPTGMMLAHELALAGVSFELVDRLARRSELSKAGGVQSRTQEALDQRGLLEPLLATGNHPVTTAHFAGNLLPLAGERHRLPWRSVPQVVVEEFLEKHLAGQGVQVRRNHELVALDGTTATFADGSVLRSRYVVAADGGRSTVRKLLGADFPGRAGTATSIAADVRLSAEVPMHTTNDGYQAHVFPLGVDPAGRPLKRLALRAPGSVAREVPVTEEEIRTGLRRVFSDRVELLELLYGRRITNASRQAARYRHGDVFLAGDAAHVHLPLGAQGMNTGIQDAVNLGWKLAAAVHGWAPDGLLDTYHAERHPVGAAVLRNTRAQSLLMDWEGTGSPDVAAARSLFEELVQLRAVQYHLDDTLSGMGIRYAMPGSHPLVGLPAPAVAPSLLHSGRGVLLDPARRFDALHLSRVDRVPSGREPMLIRPDGYVAWAGDEAELAPALARWFGEPLA